MQIRDASDLKLDSLKSITEGTHIRDASDLKLDTCQVHLIRWLTLDSQLQSEQMHSLIHVSTDS